MIETEPQVETKISEIKLTRVKFTAAEPDEKATGLLGYIKATLNGVLQIDGLTLRRTVEGRHALSFPARKDDAGNQHFFFRPLNDEVRREIEAQVFQALGIEEGAW